MHYKYLPGSLILPVGVWTFLFLLFELVSKYFEVEGGNYHIEIVTHSLGLATTDIEWEECESISEGNVMVNCFDRIVDFFSY